MCSIGSASAGGARVKKEFPIPGGSTGGTSSGGGARVKKEFPIPGGSSSGGASQGRGSNGGNQAIQQKPFKILIVGTNLDTLRIHRERFYRHKCDVVSVCSGSDALAYLGVLPHTDEPLDVDLVVTNYDLDGGMTGMFLFNSIRRSSHKTRNLPVSMLYSGYYAPPETSRIDAYTKRSPLTNQNVTCLVKRLRSGRWPGLTHL